MLIWKWKGMCMGITKKLGFRWDVGCELVRGCVLCRMVGWLPDAMPSSPEPVMCYVAWQEN